MEIINKNEYKQALGKVRAVLGFKTHLILYIILIVTLLYVNLTFSPEFYWFVFPTVGAGIGLFFHWFHVFGKSKYFGSDWGKQVMNKLVKQETEPTESTNSNSKFAEQRIRARVKKLSSFYIHLFIYIISNALIFSVQFFNTSSGESVSFNYSVAILWGVFLFFNAFDVLINVFFFGKSWEEKKIREYTSKENQTKWE